MVKSAVLPGYDRRPNPRWVIVELKKKRFFVKCDKVHLVCTRNVADAYQYQNIGWARTRMSILRSRYPDRDFIVLSIEAATAMERLRDDLRGRRTAP